LFEALNAFAKELGLFAAALRFFGQTSDFSVA
jgi:hypothetical protein